MVSLASGLTYTRGHDEDLAVGLVFAEGKLTALRGGGSYARWRLLDRTQADRGFRDRPRSTAHPPRGRRRGKLSAVEAHRSGQEDGRRAQVSYDRGEDRHEGQPGVSCEGGAEVPVDLCEGGHQGHLPDSGGPRRGRGRGRCVRELDPLGPRGRKSTVASGCLPASEDEGRAQEGVEQAQMLDQGGGGEPPGGPGLPHEGRDEVRGRICEGGEASGMRADW